MEMRTRRGLATLGLLLISVPVLLGLAVVGGGGVGGGGGATLVHTHTDSASGGSTLNPATALSPSGTALSVGTTGPEALSLVSNNVSRWTVASGGDFVPASGGAYYLGSSPNSLLGVWASNVASPSTLSLQTTNASSLFFLTNGASRWSISATGNFLPAVNDALNIGDATFHASYVYTHRVKYIATAFSALGTPADGTQMYCQDCTRADPCAGSGPGAFAKRINGVWVCN